MSVQKTYVGSLYEKEYTVKTGETKQIFYIFGGNGAIAIYSESDKNEAVTAYLHKDHLGSIVAISDAVGKLKEELSFDAWGNRRDPGTWKTKNVTPMFARDQI